MKKCIALIILDGWGYRTEKENNAIASADTPFFNSLWNNFPHTLLDASGEAVGLLPGVIGNSEVGHMTIGAGRTIETDLMRIGKAITSRDYKKTPAFHKLFESIKANNSTLHVMGLLSASGVHSHQDHLFEFLTLAKEEGVHDIAVHVFTDGRDSSPQSATGYLRTLENMLSKLGVGRIATLCGRYYAMDRDQNWDRTAVALDAIMQGAGEKCINDKPSTVLEEKYKTGVQDEHLKPLIFGESEANRIRQNDAVFFFNFRNDRVRQLCYKILEETKDQNVFLATMTEYAPDIGHAVAFPRFHIKNTLAETVAHAGFSQAHIAETEKYAHVTYFFNGERKEPYPGEEQILIDSRKDVRTHNQAPEMRAREIADRAVEHIENGTDLLVINFANADMVGHTADFEATKQAVAVVDRELKRIVEVLDSHAGVAFITADHGNAEINVEPSSGSRHTAHTLSQVPAIVTIKDLVLKKGSLADVAPTILTLLGLPIPKEMTGKVLFDKIS